MKYRDEAWELIDYWKIVLVGPVTNAEELLKGETPVLCRIADLKQVTPTELARYFSLSTARVAAILNHLEKKGYIRRIHDTEDRRKVYVSPTEEGIGVAGEKMEELHSKARSLLEALGPEDAREYVRLTGKVARYVKKQMEE